MWVLLFDLCDLYVSLQAHAFPPLIFLGMRTEHKYKLLQFTILCLFVSFCSWSEIKTHNVTLKKLTLHTSHKHTTPKAKSGAGVFLCFTIYSYILYLNLNGRCSYTDTVNYLFIFLQQFFGARFGNPQHLKWVMACAETKQNQHNMSC